MTWFDMYSEFIKNFEKITQLQKDYIRNLEQTNYLYNESIKNIVRINDLYNEFIRNYEKMNRLYEQQFDNVQRINQKWFMFFRSHHSRIKIKRVEGTLCRLATSFHDPLYQYHVVLFNNIYFP